MNPTLLPYSEPNRSGGPGSGPRPTTDAPPVAPTPAPTPAEAITAYRQQAQTWLVGQRNRGATPDRICTELVAQGWDADTAARTALRSLRQSDRHRVLYSALCWGAGLAAVGAATAAHLALSERAEPLDLAFAITLALVATPIAVFAGVTAREIEAKEPHAIWSPSRRVLFGTLALASAGVGIIRLLHYTFNLVASLVGAEGYEFTSASVVQVIVTLSAAIPLFWWSHREWRRSNVARRSLGSTEV